MNALSGSLAINKMLTPENVSFLMMMSLLVEVTF